MLPNLQDIRDVIVIDLHAILAIKVMVIVCLTGYQSHQQRSMQDVKREKLQQQ
jgi:hypothetical protein